MSGALALASLAVCWALAGWTPELWEGSVGTMQATRIAPTNLWACALTCVFHQASSTTNIPAIPADEWRGAWYDLLRAPLSNWAGAYIYAYSPVGAHTAATRTVTNVWLTEIVPDAAINRDWTWMPWAVGKHWPFWGPGTSVYEWTSVVGTNTVTNTLTNVLSATASAVPWPATSAVGTNVYTNAIGGEAALVWESYMALRERYLAAASLGHFGWTPSELPYTNGACEIVTNWDQVARFVVPEEYKPELGGPRPNAVAALRSMLDSLAGVYLTNLAGAIVVTNNSTTTVVATTFDAAALSARSGAPSNWIKGVWPYTNLPSPYGVATDLRGDWTTNYTRAMTSGWTFAAAGTTTVVGLWRDWTQAVVHASNETVILTSTNAAILPGASAADYGLKHIRAACSNLVAICEAREPWEKGYTNIVDQYAYGVQDRDYYDGWPELWWPIDPPCEVYWNIDWETNAPSYDTVRAAVIGMAAGEWVVQGTHYVIWYWDGWEVVCLPSPAYGQKANTNDVSWIYPESPDAPGASVVMSIGGDSGEAWRAARAARPMITNLYTAGRTVRWLATWSQTGDTTNYLPCPYPADGMWHVQETTTNAAGTTIASSALDWGAPSLPEWPATNTPDMWPSGQPSWGLNDWDAVFIWKFER